MKPGETEIKAGSEKINRKFQSQLITRSGKENMVTVNKYLYSAIRSAASENKKACGIRETETSLLSESLFICYIYLSPNLNYNLLCGPADNITDR